VVERTVQQLPPQPPRLAFKQGPRAVQADLAHTDPKIRRAATREVDDPKLLLDQARDADLEVAYVATTKLVELHAQGVISAQDMVARVRDRSSPAKVRAVALSGLGQVASPEAAAVLVELSARGDLIERRSSVALLAHQDPALAVPALIAALGDDDRYVRSQALDSLRARSRGRDFGTDAAAWRAWWEVESRR
jgi:hypothetical protein